MAHLRLWFVLITATLAATALHAEEISWQEAVMRLRQERNQAETCAAVLKKYAKGAALARGALSYAAAKDDYDGTIGGLTTALGENKRPASVPDLEGRLRRGFQERQAFCEEARRMLPPSTPGEKSIGEEIVGGAVGPVIGAAVKLLDEAVNGPPGRRDTIITQLQAATWPSFASVSPLS